MTSVCISHCLNDARVPVRATYVNLYKWPESDAEFVRSVSSNREKGSHVYGHPRVVDSISCRQMYLRSYTFSREEDKDGDKAQKCFGVKKKKKRENNNSKPETGKRKCFVWSKAKEISCSALSRFFRRVLFCSASVDVVHDKY
ncbi:hypothetical protein LR48_Vigan03g232500 [Vigna angularis]|uniref:Uncharacterized protein n=2 Tax=Phaseolus angularis TaxID=3914 RepID=A0A0L9U829_PHAAN|nr:uncharacterized protein LOC108328745 [Vigna angularis]KAG2406005.1 uncharacterized protein HKW66_Vig0052600 [Vigna angularis]KOM38943.1 hypothetical protein LR48_Vigan03g232500 [Vigna angularis]BAT85652.1 hypothetical protein VIGAN_04322300 [Vigna angularis var. angularis]